MDIINPKELDSKFLDLIIFCPITTNLDKIVIFWNNLDDKNLEHIKAMFITNEIFLISNKEFTYKDSIVNKGYLTPNIKQIKSISEITVKNIDLLMMNLFEKEEDNIKALNNISKILELLSPKIVIIQSNNSLNKLLFDSYSKSNIYNIYKPTKDIWNAYYFYDREFINVIILNKK